MKIHGNLVFETAIKGRYDHLPPADLEAYDVEAVNGLGIAF